MERRKAMKLKQAARRKMSRRVNKKHRAKRDGQNRDGAVRRNPKSIRAATKMTNGTPGTVRKNGAPIRSRRAPAFRNPKTELEAAIQRFVDLYDFATIAYVSFDRAGRIEEANLVATELLGEPRDRLIGRPFAFYVGDLDLFLRHLLDCRTSQQQVETELELKPRKGERIPALLCSRPITSTTRNGALLYQTAIMDLSERKRAEQALQESSQRLQATYERAPIGITECSPEGKYVGANEEFCRILGYRKEELMQRGIKDVTHKEDYSREIKLHRQLVAGEIPFYEIEKRYVRKDGAIIWAQILRSIVRDAGGTPLYTIGAVRDVTEHKAAEEKVKWLAAYPRDNPNPILEFDLQTNAISYANPSTLKLFPDLERLQLRHPFLIRVLQIAKPMLEGKTKAVHTEINIGKTCYAATVVCIPKTRRLRVYSSDISDRKRAEAALRRSRALLEKLVQQRTKALRTANVELQSEIVRRKGLEGQILEISDREQERLGQELHDGLCQQLTAIGFLARATALRLKDHRVVQVDDLERIAQLINGSVMDARNIARDLHKEEIDAAEFVQALRDLAERKIWKTLCRFDLKTEVNIEDDTVASQLYRILREAVINANKHARAKQIVLEAKRSGSDLVFSVTDDGVGLNPKGKLAQGLGFHIMKYRADSIGARLELESLKKGGTRMAVYLPIGQ